MGLMPENEPSSPPESELSGLITSIKAQTKDPSRVSVFVDGAFAIGIHRDVISDSGLREGDFVGAPDLRSLREAENLHQARRAAVHLLSYRPRTTAEIQNRLVRKGYAKGVAGRVVADLEEGGLLDDDAFAREFTVQRAQSRRVGQYRIRRDLVRRGIDIETADRVVTVCSQGTDWRSAAMDLAVRKWETIPVTLPLPKKRKRLFDYLARRGFDFEIIRTVVNEVAV